MPSARRPVPVRARVLAVALTVGLSLLTPLLAPAATATAADGPAGSAGSAGTGLGGSSPAAPAAAPVGARGPVVLIGTSGLRWDDVSPVSTPALWGLAQEGAIGNAVVRSVRPSTCPADGWLAVSAGNRAADLPNLVVPSCRALEDPAADGAIPGWEDYRDAADAASFDARLGTLGEALGSAEVAATAIGPGAALALAGPDGRLAFPHRERPEDPAALTPLLADALERSELVVLDVGTVRDRGYATRARAPGDTREPAADAGPSGPGRPTATPAPQGDGEASTTEVLTEPDRAEQVQQVDAAVGAALAAVDAHAPDALVLVVSLGDSSSRPHLQFGAVRGRAAPGTVAADAVEYADAQLISSSTRQAGYVLVTDLLPTLAAALDVDTVPAGVAVGSPLRPTPGPDTAAARIAALVDAGDKSDAVRPLIAPFYVIFIVVNLLLYAAVTLGLNRRVIAWTRRTEADPSHWYARAVVAVRTRPVTVLRWLRAVAIAVASIPVATFLANLLPWWRAGDPARAVTAVVVAWIALISALALLPRWRHWLLGPVGVVSAITAVLFAVDIGTGAGLQLAALMGTQPLVAGRFYGFNNTAFPLFAAATILWAVAVTNPLVARGRRGVAAAIVAVTGVVATVLDGLPSIGADFGGPPALVPAFALLTALAAGWRLNWRRVAAILAGGVVVVSAFALADYARPPQDRTHLGGFVETVLNGGLLPVVTRKLQQNLDTVLGNKLTLLAVGGLLLVVFVLGRPLRTVVNERDGGPYGWLSSGAPLARLADDAPMLRPGLTALAVTLGIGFAVNDSGILIPAVGVALAVPLIVAAYASWMIGLHERLRSEAGISGATPPARDAAG